MPDLTGVSNGAAQSVIPTRAFTAANIQLLFTANVNAVPLRVGYGFVLAQNTTAPAYRRILWRGDIQLPGEWIEFPSDFGFTNVNYLFYVRWNIAGIAWLARYS